MKEPDEKKTTWDSPPFDPLAIAMGIENKRGRKNGIRTPSTNTSWNGRRLEERSHDSQIQTHS
jgi:hypothetical protein